MAGAEHGNTEADVGEGRMAASEGANGGEYADEGQDGRGKKIFTKPLIFLSYFLGGSAWSGREETEKKIVFKMHILTAFEGPSTSGR